MSERSDVVLNKRYRLLEPAGTGGMATVYKGQDLMLGRLVAIKLLHESMTGDAEFLHRFQKEAHAAANLTHPNIVTVHDIGQDGHQYYIVMEFVKGATLKDFIRRFVKESNRPLPLHQALDLGIQICSGIGYAHRANLVHCDVKSQNVLVTHDNRVKVTDFGIARALSESSLHDESVVWGTPQYFSPEQAAGEPATPASDVYSIGVILFEMLTGQLPFQAESHTALAVKHMRATAPLVSDYNPIVPQQMARIVAKVLAKEPTGRYRTADQLGRILAAYRESSLQDTGPSPSGSESEQPEVITEAKTEYYLPGTAKAASTGRKTTPHPAGGTARSPSAPHAPRKRVPAEIHLPAPRLQETTEWKAVLLGLIALVSLLGLIPLWYLVYLRYAGS